MPNINVDVLTEQQERILRNDGQKTPKQMFQIHSSNGTTAAFEWVKNEKQLVPELYRRRRKSNPRVYLSNFWHPPGNDRLTEDIYSNKRDKSLVSKGQTGNIAPKLISSTDCYCQAQW
jgi:hypothetical protein